MSDRSNGVPEANRDRPGPPITDPTPGDRKAMAAILLGVVTTFVALTTPASLNGVIHSALHTTGAQLSWISAIFLVPTASLELTFGLVGDRFGRQRLIVAGAFLIAVGSFLGALAPTATTLLIAQAISGVGAAALLPSSLVSVATHTRPGKARTRGITLWALSLSMGAAVGPPVLGLLSMYASFHWAYAVVGGLALVAAGLNAAWTRNSVAPKTKRIDVPGQILFAVALTALLYGVIQGASASYTDPLILVCLIGGAIMIVVFVVVEIRTEHSLINTALFRSVTYSGAMVVAIVAAIGMFGYQYAVSLRVGVVQDQSPVLVGLTSTLQIAGQLALWPLIARLLFGVSPRVVIIGGMTCMAGAQFWMAAIPISDTSLLTLTPSLVLSGLGFVSVVSSTSAAVVDVPPEIEGVASGTINMARDTGAAIGIAVVGAFALTRSAADLPEYLTRYGITGQARTIVDQVAAADGPIAVAHAPLGPIAARSMPAAQEALWHGFSMGVIGTGLLSCVAIVVAVLTIRAKAPVTRSLQAGEVGADGEYVMADGTTVSADRQDTLTATTPAEGSATGPDRGRTA